VLKPAVVLPAGQTPLSTEHHLLRIFCSPFLMERMTTSPNSAGANARTMSLICALYGELKFCPERVVLSGWNHMTRRKPELICKSNN
jgi:hypothetical protein